LDTFSANGKVVVWGPGGLGFYGYSTPKQQFLSFAEIPGIQTTKLNHQINHSLTFAIEASSFNQLQDATTLGKVEGRYHGKLGDCISKGVDGMGVGWAAMNGLKKGGTGMK